MKFIRNWIKNIIRETILENFPSMNITITDSNESNIKAKFEHTIFNDSQIIFSKELKGEMLDVSNCDINTKDKPFIDMEGE